MGATGSLLLRGRVWVLAAVLALSTIAPASAAPAPGARLWVRPSTDDRYAVAVAPNGARTYVTGERYGTVAYNAATGARLWSRGGGGQEDCPDYYDVGADIAVSPDGSTVFVTGSASRWGPGDFGCGSVWWTVAYDAVTGATRWQREGGPYGEEISARALAVGPDGGSVFVIGDMWGCGWVVAYDAVTGEENWSAENWLASGCIPANDVIVGPNSSRVFLTGASWEGAGDSDLATMALDAMTGEPLWSASYDGLHGGDVGGSVAIAPNGGRLYVTGMSRGVRSEDFVTVAYAPATGAVRWVARYNGGPAWRDVVHAVQVSPNGRRVFVTGESGPGYETADVATIAYDATTGIRAWTARYRGSAGGRDAVQSLGVHPLGVAVYVAGSSSDVDHVDALTLAYDATTGRRLWMARYGPGEANALAVGPAGAKVFIAGSATIAYAS